MRVFEVEVTQIVRVVVHENTVIDRCTNNEDAWRQAFYDFKTSEEVAEHLGFNRLVNDIDHVSQLEGWADVGQDAVVFTMKEQHVSARETGI